jgi:hypothetical protein
MAAEATLVAAAATTTGTAVLEVPVLAASAVGLSGRAARATLTTGEIFPREWLSTTPRLRRAATGAASSASDAFESGEPIFAASTAGACDNQQGRAVDQRARAAPTSRSRPQRTRARVG